MLAASMQRMELVEEEDLWRASFDLGCAMRCDA